MTEPIVLTGNILKGGQEHLPVLIVPKNWLSLVSSACDMIDGTLKFKTQGTCHSRMPLQK
jgi:hypothetical protein